MIEFNIIFITNPYLDLLKWAIVIIILIPLIIRTSDSEN